jgi:hypothetical protein
MPPSPVYAEIERHQKITPVGFGAHDDRIKAAAAMPLQHHC